MKKILIFVLLGLISVNTCTARDYTKMQIKELKHAQKYGNTNNYLYNGGDNSEFNASKKFTGSVKDPGIMQFSHYVKITDEQYNEKLAKDNQEYKKIAKEFNVRNIDNYNATARGEYYYKLYRISEKIIRANNLDFINWRIGVYRDTKNPNAFNTNMNLVAISTSLYDTLMNNDDALALVIGHEMSHALMGHQQRRVQTLAKMERQRKLAERGNGFSTVGYVALKRKFLADSKNMEYAADIEGAKLAAKAGYNLDNASETLSFINTLAHDSDFWSDHPEPQKRIDSFSQNRKYFIEKEWAEMGKYNIYNSEVLPVTLSSDRASIVISAPTSKINPSKYFQPETLDEVYARVAYRSYINGEFNKALENFDKLFEIDKTNASAYLYASYTAQAAGKKELAKTYIQKAKQLEPDNKYIKEQIDSL